ncbi:MAG TPA: hypothetical protein VF752_02970 [Thermoleophilaceae bacterium]
MPLDRRNIAKRVLLAPHFVRRAAASQAAAREEGWLLRQPKDVRASYVREVLDKGDGPRLAEIWMLRQRREVRESYIREVLGAD